MSAWLVASTKQQTEAEATTARESADATNHTLLETSKPLLITQLIVALGSSVGPFVGDLLHGGRQAPSQKGVVSSFAACRDSSGQLKGDAKNWKH